MKVLLFVLVVSLSSFMVVAQPSVAPIPPDLSTAFAKGDASTISSYFADKVELKLAGEAETLTKADATTRLREFFTTHPAQSFQISPMTVEKAEGDENVEGKEVKKNYEKGELTTESGKYKVYIHYTEPESNKRKITALKFEQ